MIDWQDRRQARRVKLLVAVFYGAMALFALLWAHQWSGRETIIILDATVRGGGIFGAVVGLLTGATLAIIFDLGQRRFLWAARLALEFRQRLGRPGPGVSLWLAGWSALGEEFLFRGALQYSWGILASALLFALCHFPVRRVLLPWTIVALVAGLLFSGLYLLTGNLWAPLLAHFVINLAGLHRLRRPLPVPAIPAGTVPASAPAPPDGTAVKGRFVHFE